MTKSRGNLAQVKPFFSRYKEISITYDVNTLTVECDGRTPEGFWENFMVQEDVNSPQDYAFGMYDVFHKLFPNMEMSVTPEPQVIEEGFFLADLNSEEA